MGGFFIHFLHSAKQLYNESMKNQLKTILFSVFVIVVLASVFLVLRNMTDNPARVVEKFYSEWISTESPLSNKIYLNNRYLTDGFIKSLNETLITAAEGTDPVLCSDNRPSSYQINQKDNNGDLATFTVVEKWNGDNEKEIIVSLIRAGLIWRIDGISCGIDIASQETVENKVSSYITDNISDLSPEKETLGGKFFVTQLYFDGGNSGVVSYEDGHVAFTATFNYSVDELGNVIVTDFNILPTPADNSDVEIPESEESRTFNE